MGDVLKEYKSNMAKEASKKRIKSIKWLKFRIWFLKRKWWILGIAALFALIVFPSETGTAIGEWITKFVGSLIKAINI
jgi:hypothetical protein